jgi:hypothetical protein
MRAAAVWGLVVVACGTPPAPQSASNAPPSVTVPDAGPPPPPAKPPPVPSLIVTPVTLGRTEALVPDDSCFRGPLHFLGYRGAPDAETEASYVLVSGEQACKVSTRRRAEILLAKAESHEQTATCGAWRVANCTNGSVEAAVPTPPFEKVSSFGLVPFGWQNIDSQADGLGEARPPHYDERISGSNLTIRYTRKGFVIIRAGDKNLDALWVDAFFEADGQPYAVTDQDLVLLGDPLRHQPLPALFGSDTPPEPKPYPWAREN